MSPAERKKVAGYVDDIVSGFRTQFAEDRAGWGQFLDSNIGHDQVGRYGTSAGAIALGVGQEQSTATAGIVSGTLENWLLAEDEKSISHRSQTLPLVMIYLGLCFLKRTDRGTAEITDSFLLSVKKNILNRQHEHSGLWGNYWLDSKTYDETHSVFVSSLVLLVLFLAENASRDDDRLVNACEALEENYLKNPDAYSDFSLLVVTTILVYLGKKASRRIREVLAKASLKSPDIGSRFNYFYDYALQDDNWSREYFILPVALTEILVLHAESVPGGTALRVSKIGKELKENLDQNQGLFRVSQVDRISTLEQGFAVLALEALLQDESRPSSFSDFGRYKYHLWVERPDWDSWGYYIVLVAYAAVTVANSLPLFFEDLYSVWQDAIVKSTLFVVGVVSDPKTVVRKALRLD